jgi:hypothetical protein
VHEVRNGVASSDGEHCLVGTDVAERINRRDAVVELAIA